MPKVPIYPPIKSVEIRIYWEDKTGEGSNGFATVQELAAFLRDNPELGKAVNYVPGKK